MPDVFIPAVRRRTGTASRTPSPGLPVRWALAACLCALASVAGAQVEFEDTSLAAGVNYAGESYGASVGYANSDSLPDLFISRHRGRPALLINMGNGTFEDRYFEVDVWDSVPFADQHGGSFADFDNDGDMDLLITAGSKNNTQFLVNNGQFYVDRMASYTFDRPQWGGRMPIWFDFTLDGRLDMALAVQGQKLQLHEQTASDFTRVNFRTIHECQNNDYALLQDMNFDGFQDLVCLNQNQFPEFIYDYSASYPFVDISAQSLTYNFVVDTLVADFDNDLVPEFFGIRGRARISGAEQTGANSIEAHLIEQNGSFATVTFQSAGDVSMEFHWNARNASDVHYGASDTRAPFPGQGEPIRLELSASDPDVVGMPPYDPSVTGGIFVGYDPATETWTLAHSSGDRTDGSYLYAYIDSTEAVSEPEVTGLGPLDSARQPLYLKYDAGAGRWAQMIGGTGLDNAIKCVAAVAADFDNDMDQDLYMVCRNAVSNAPNKLLLNDGNGVFTEVTDAGGAAGPVGYGVGLSENVVTTDYDMDGFVDLLVTNGLKLFPEEPYTAGGPDKLFRNRGNGNNWIQVDLEGVESNRDGVGAVVTVTAGNVAQRREQNGGYHRWSQNDKRLHFGLANNDTVDIDVTWPSGQTGSYQDVDAGQVVRIVEGETDIVPVTPPDTVPPSPCEATAGQPPINADTDSGMFIWKDSCEGNTWRVRIASAGTAATLYTGAVRSSSDITNVQRVQLEPDDQLILDASATQLNYRLTVGGGSIDGFNFTAGNNARVCVGINGNIGTALIGRNRTPVNLPVDLETLGPCDLSSPLITISDASLLERDPSGVMVFPLTLDFAGTDTITVDYTTQDGLAVAPDDYTATSGTLEFAPGETTATIEVPIIDDTLIEFPETFSVVLSNPVGAILGNSVATGTIEDDDATTCGAPVYDRATEPGVYVWQNCNNGEWFLRVAAGGVEETYVGSVQAEAPFAAVTPFSIEPVDTLDFTTDPAVISFSLEVTGEGQDGFNFRETTTGRTCLDITAPALQVQVGAFRNPVTPPFDLRTLGTCFPSDADLVTVLSLASSDPKPNVGDAVALEIRVRNAGGEPANGVTLTGRLPAGLDYVSHTVTHGNYDRVTGGWGVGTIASGATATLQINATVGDGQHGNKITMSTTAAVGQEDDPSTAGDQLSATVTIASRNVPVVDQGGSFGGSGTVGPGGGIAARGWGNAAMGAILESMRRYVIDFDSAFVPGGNPGRSFGILGAGTDSGNTGSGSSGKDNGAVRASGPDAALNDHSHDHVHDYAHFEPAPPVRVRSTVGGSGAAASSGASDRKLDWDVIGDPANEQWIVGFSQDRNNANWKGVEFGLECDNGSLIARHKGESVGSGGRLQTGDVISLSISGTTLEYRKNGVTFAAVAMGHAVGNADGATYRLGNVGLDGLAPQHP